MFQSFKEVCFFFNINVENVAGIAMVNLKRFENNCRNIEI